MHWSFCGLILIRGMLKNVTKKEDRAKVERATGGGILGSKGNFDWFMVHKLNVSSMDWKTNFRH